MSTSRAKRQFAGAAADPAQRQITSFFTKAPEGNTAALKQPMHAPLQGPVLPTSVQADLINVGMRVRKSVLEGYKLGDSTSAFKLWTDSSTRSPDFSPPEPAAKPTPPHHHQAVAVTVTRPTRELLPFCGIHKTGGLAAQPDLDEQDDLDFDEDLPSLDDIPEFTISQESADSYVCEPSRKRGFDGGFDGDDEARDPDAQWSQLGDSARVIALPRTRAKGGQDSALVDDDFEEAAFLVFGDDH